MAAGTIQYGVLSLLASLPFISASVISEHSQHSLLNRRATGASCRLSDGRTIPDGHNFTRVNTGPCVSYMCTNGQVLPMDYQCYRDGRCFPLNDVYKLGCIERTCKLTNGHFDYVVTKEGCTGHDTRTCVDVGSTYKDGCFGYRCDKTMETAFGVSYHLKQVEAGCELDGQCVPVNHTYTKSCRTMQCQKRYMAVGFFTIKNGCEFNGQCVDVNGHVEYNCRTYTCTEESISGLKVFNIRPTKIRCKDAYDTCHEPGDWFTLLVDDRNPVNCTCSVTGTNSYTVSVSCPEIGIGVGPRSPPLPATRLGD